MKELSEDKLERKIRGLEQKTRKLNNKIDKKWKKLRSRAEACPDCYSSRLWLARSTSRKLKRYWVECGDCHWCGKSKTTIRMAVNAWNRDCGKKHAEVLRRMYGGDAE